MTVIYSSFVMHIGHYLSVRHLNISSFQHPIFVPVFIIYIRNIILKCTCSVLICGLFVISQPHNQKKKASWIAIILRWTSIRLSSIVLAWFSIELSSKLSCFFFLHLSDLSLSFWDRAQLHFILNKLHQNLIAPELNCLEFNCTRASSYQLWHLLNLPLGGCDCTVG
jgi:hypothetical protein